MGANTTTSKVNQVLIIPHATWDADWSCVSDLGWETMRINSIVFKGGTANDVLIMRNGALDGPELVNWKIGGDTEEQIFYGKGQTFIPYIDASECVGDADCRIIIHFK